MKILTYSDLHLEFSHGWLPGPSLDGDLMILAGDILTFTDLYPAECFFKAFAGNHEYYMRRPWTRRT